MGTRRYTTVCGFFLQDDPESNELPPRFGLKDDNDDRWVKFKGEIEQLNASAPSGTQYKVVFLGRHGEGYHNVAMKKYTVEACRITTFWSKLDGDGELVWGPDPDLTNLGVEQAKDANCTWKTELEYGIPLPEKLYSSPMRRAIKTNQVTFEGVLRPSLKTTIVENTRERNGVSTCDKRRKKSEIASDFPDYPFEEGFIEEDEIWDPDVRETFEEVDVRAKKVLDMIFDKDEEQFISITSHYRFIDAFRRVCGHLPWDLPTGGEYL
ncbi:histidine phosphatase superfamily [Boletus edulis BED1]|uniref:Histidine phosphatase superfamily n=1 Tax=Boletus edulis BED1 TaxID=1328754 RepID=A0AAD4GCD5_BOLED|nr:histidine phosphatase superfamily [Boletus edulis BED1]